MAGLRACVLRGGRPALAGLRGKLAEHLPLRVWEQTRSPGAGVILRRALGPGHRLPQHSEAWPRPPRSGAGDGFQAL